jgi:adenylate cyclase
MDGRWRIELLGGLRAVLADDSAEATTPLVFTRFPTYKAGALLAVLAYDVKRTHPRDELVELLWPEHDPIVARRSLSTELYRLRRQLEQPGVPQGAFLVSDRHSIGLNPAAITTDVAAFQTVLRSAAGARSDPERVGFLAQAVALYRGELLCGYYEPWVLREREGLAERYLQALRQLVGLLEAAGEMHRGLDYARRAVSVDPLREEAHVDLMRLLGAVGEPAAALRQYRELERLLKEELGATPAPATRALARDLQRLAVTRPQPSTSPARPSVPPPPAVPAREQRLTQGTGESRVVTVLFAGMSRSVETLEKLDPEDAVALVDRLLREMVEVLVQYEGRVVRFLGDGVFAVFGVPQAHEDDPERAIRAALEIREGARQIGLELTAGIHTGEVYVGEIGSEPQQEMKVIGRTVNLAARLQEQAQPGQILVGATTYRQSRRAFAFTSFSVAVQGSPQPVNAYAAGRAVPRPKKARGIDGLRAALIGRDGELTKLTAVLDELRRGRGQMVSLIGEAGVGKSRLVAELESGVQAFRRSGVQGEEDLLSLTPEGLNARTPVLWLEGRCLELGMTASYWLFADLFRDYFAWRPEEDDQARGERLVTSLGGLVERGDLTAEQADEIGPLLGNLLSLSFGTDWDDRLQNASPEQIKHRTFLAIRDFLLALARRQPLVLVLEDLHWADALSLDVISLLLETLTLAPLLLICVYRPEREHRCWRLGTIATQKCREQYTELTLSELTLAQSRRLVEALVAIDLPGAVTELILERARGNPFFVEEVIHSLIDAGLVYREGSEWRAQEGISALAVPASVQAVIHGRVDRLGPELKRVLESASVIGRLFRRRLLERCLEGETVLDGALWELEERALIYQERVVPEEEYSFKHVLTQETIYRKLPRRRRASLHQRVGEAIEGLYAASLEEQYEPLAYHYERSNSDEKAVEYLLKAGEKARRAYLKEEALGYVQRAWGKLDRSALGEARRDWQLEALTGLGRIYDSLGESAPAEERFRQAIALGHQIGLPARRLVRLYHDLACTLSGQGRFEEMIRLGEEGLALLGEETETVEAALMNTRIALGGRLLGDDRWREFHYRNAQFLQRLPYSEELSSAYFHLAAMVAEEKEIEEAAAWLKALERQAEQHNDLGALGAVHEYTAGLILAARGDLIGANSRAERALELYAKIGISPGPGFCLGMMSRRFLSLGDLPRAEEGSRAWAEVTTRMGNLRHAGWAYEQLGTIWLCQGSRKKAVEALQKAYQLFWETRHPDMAEYALRLARAYLADGRRREALTQFHEALTLGRSDPFVLAVSLGNSEPFALAAALSGLEELYDDPETFRVFCRRFREEHPEVSASPFAHWFLEPTELRGFSQRRIHDEFGASLAPDWAWQDPFGDCSFKVQNGLEIHAANGRDLWHVNLSAPRVLQPALGEFAAQTLCAPVSPDRPALGGLLLWKDETNYLRLDRGTRGKHEISFCGCLDNRDLLFGRGRLPGERVFLRLERIGSRVSALCSADGGAWFAVGCVEFPAEDPVAVGLNAIGSIDRTLYPGAYPDGTAIRFERFELWMGTR